MKNIQSVSALAIAFSLASGPVFAGTGDRVTEFPRKSEVVQVDRQTVQEAAPEECEICAQQEEEGCHFSTCDVAVEDCEFEG